MLESVLDTDVTLNAYSRSHIDYRQRARNGGIVRRGAVHQ